MPAHNPFKTALAAGQPRIGLWLSMADPYLAEAAATCGYDWLLIDGEHAPNDVRSTLAALQAVAPHPAQAVVRVVEGSTALIKQMLDIGATTLLVPMVDTAEQARAVVAARRYRSEEHTSELQSPDHLVCRLLLEKKKKKDTIPCTKTRA